MGGFRLSTLAAVTFAIVLAAPALAQTAAPSNASNAGSGTPIGPAKPARHAKVRRHVKAAPAAPTPVVHNAWDDVPDPHALPTPNDHTKIPATTGAAPVSFGMKWNGSNDSSTQTRVQNYNGTAEGAGAELGMKMHF